MFTLVLETEVERLDKFWQQQQEMFRDPKWIAPTANMPNVSVTVSAFRLPDVPVSMPHSMRA
jgi:hypothetical protein